MRYALCAGLKKRTNAQTQQENAKSANVANVWETPSPRMLWLLCLLLGASARGQPAAPLLTVNLSAPLDAVDPRLFGLNLEFTRHDLFAGLSAQLLGNRLFALQPPGTAWPQPVSWGSQ